jgi:hypothetical protein
VKNGWQTKTIGDVCEFQRGLTYAKGDEVDVSDNVVLRATNIDLATNRLIFDELKYINDKVIVPESKKVKKGALMICTASGSKSHLGKVALIDEDYGLAGGKYSKGACPYAEEAVETLVGTITQPEFKGNMLVIMAGYEDLMDHMFASVNQIQPSRADSTRNVCTSCRGLRSRRPMQSSRKSKRKTGRSLTRPSPPCAVLNLLALLVQNYKY